MSVIKEKKQDSNKGEEEAPSEDAAVRVRERLVLFWGSGFGVQGSEFGV